MDLHIWKEHGQYEECCGVMSRELSVLGSRKWTRTVGRSNEFRAMFVQSYEIALSTRHQITSLHFLHTWVEGAYPSSELTSLWCVLRFQRKKHIDNARALPCNIYADFAGRHLCRIPDHTRASLFGFQGKCIFRAQKHILATLCQGYATSRSSRRNEFQHNRARHCIFSAFCSGKCIIKQQRHLYPAMPWPPPSCTPLQALILQCMPTAKSLLHVVMLQYKVFEAWSPFSFLDPWTQGYNDGAPLHVWCFNTEF